MKLHKLLLTIFMSCLALDAQAAEVTPLNTATFTWDGTPLHYPKSGNAEATAIKIKLAPGEAPAFHCHPVPTLGYMLLGAIEVELMTSGEKKMFKQGDAVFEVVNTWHRGKNISETEPAEFVVFYTGTKGIENTIPYSEETKDQCK